MRTESFTVSDLDALAAFDTPTVCNALEQIAPELQGAGYTTRAFVCGFPQQKPVVGYARTATIRSAHALGLSTAAQQSLRNDYYRYVERGPRPSIAVIQDLDDPAGCGAFWGEVQSAIHVGLGARAILTNGAVRDLDQWAPGFQFLAGSIAPSHAFARPVGFGEEVQVFGLRVRPGDLVHADRHGAVIVPPALVRAVPAAAREIAAREARILAVARGRECTADKLIAVFAQHDAVH